MARTRSAVSAVDRAIPFLLAAVERVRKSGHPRLPNVKEIAAAAKVSPKTAWKAISRLREQGVVAVIPGGGVFVAPSSGQTLDPQLFTPRPADRTAQVGRLARDEQVRRAISTDILTGLLAPGLALPTYKELQQRYGACYVTLRRALRMLSDERRIEAHGKGYRVRQSLPPKGRPVLVHIGRMGPSPGLVRATPFSPEFWTQVEKERMRLSVDVELHEYDIALGISKQPGAGPSIRERYSNRTILGYFVSTIGMSTTDMEMLLMDPMVAGKPVAILGEGIKTTLGRPFLRSGLVRTFVLAGGELAGELVAEHLLNLGHRGVALFTPFVDAEFSQRRVAGVRRALERADRNCRLEVIDATLKDSFEEILRDPEFRAFRRAVSRFETRTMVDYDSPEGLFPDNIVTHHMTSQYMKRHLKPHFDRLLADRGITAWIGINDMVGLIAMRYLEGTHTPMPGRVSVVSFDDTIESFSVGLTSYNFHVPAIVHAMIEHVAGGGRRRDDDPVLEIPGTVMARGSSGTAST